MGKVKAWAMQLEEDFWYLANSKIGNCEFFGEFMQEMEQHRDFLGLHNDR